MDGRGVVRFDYDRDGDTDIFIWNNNQQVSLYRNQKGNDNNYLTVKLSCAGNNTQAECAIVKVTVNGQTQIRELRIGSNYTSQNPVQAHFGLDAAATVDELRIEWSGQSSGAGGPVDVFTNLDANH